MTLQVDTIETEAGGPVALTGQSAARAWVSGTDAAALSDSLNISSGTDNGTGDYNYAFSASFDSANFAIGNSSRSGIDYNISSDAQAVGSVDIRIFNTAGTAVNSANSLNAHGDLA